MKCSQFAAVAAFLASAATASPIEKRQSITDADILQFALTLEHLENTFYKQGLAMFSAADFVAEGIPEAYYTNLGYVSFDEEQHVRELTAGLTAAGAMPVAACSYNFPLTDAKSFVTTATVLEGVGVSAYLGAAPAIVSKEYLAIAGSILVTEAKHNSLLRIGSGLLAAADPYGTAINPNGAYTLAAAFITSCPSTNAPLPFTAFPTLTYTGATYSTAGYPFTATSSATGASYVTFVNGLNVISLPIAFDGATYSATVPSGLGGQTYVFLTNSNITALADSAIVAGPALVEVIPAAPVTDPTYY